MKRIEKKFHFATNDDRVHRKLIPGMVRKVSQILKMEPELEKKYKKSTEVLVIYTNTGYFVNKKLFQLLDRYMKSERSCYIFSNYNSTLREVIKIQEGGDTKSSQNYGIIIHAGITLSEYLSQQAKNSLVES